jgi:hypothetical protein
MEKGNQELKEIIVHERSSTASVEGSPKRFVAFNFLDPSSWSRTVANKEKNLYWFLNYKLLLGFLLKMCGFLEIHIASFAD